MQLLKELSSGKLFGISLLDFGPNGSVPSEAYEKLLGVSVCNFLELHDYVCLKMRNTRRRSTHNALAIFLMKLRLNLSHHFLAVLFGNRLNKQRISDVIASVREVLVEKFCPRYIGFQCMTRDEYICNHHTAISEQLLQSKGKAIFVIDGTYLYIQKSKNYMLQRRTYSMHKYRNLVKV